MSNQKSIQPIRIWPGLAPGETTSESGHPGDTSGNILRITGVTAAELFVYGASPGAGKPAVIVCPGGGYQVLASDLEGSEIARWLKCLGFVAPVLHYRVPDNKEGAYQDGRRAVSWVRAHASEYGIDPHRVGALGFSAGGHLVIRMAARGSERPYEPIDEVDGFSCRPDFVLGIYPGLLRSRESGLADADILPDPAMPPLFLAQSRDDPHFCTEWYAEIADKAGADVTSEVYETGGHGYGLRLSSDVDASRWKTDATVWLSLGLWES